MSGTFTPLAFDPKAQGETITYAVPFNLRLGSGETITGQSVTAQRYSGNDDGNPSAILNGGAVLNAIDGTYATQLGLQFVPAGGAVLQSITAGVTGCVYLLRYSCTTSKGQTLFEDVTLEVVQYVPST